MSLTSSRWPRTAAARAMVAAMARVERAAGLWVTPAHNPLAQAGAAATLCLLIALISGVLLLFWYVPSVHEAAPSLRALGRWGPGAWVRAAHRWSSDAAMAFLLWHGVRMGVEGRLSGPRWLAWLTGLALWLGVWFTGWIGFWMAWDARGLAVALTSTRVVDLAAPLLGDTLERSLLADSAVSSSVFFILFFVHLLLPLALGIVLWMHVRRVARAQLLPTRPVTLALCGAIALAAALSPLPLEATAALGSLPAPARLDLWYLWPLVVAMRAGEGGLVALGALGLAALGALPWIKEAREPAPQAALVQESKCNGCTQCVQDCPFGAIVMVRAADGSDRLVARVDPDLCTQCGVCVGACDPVAIDLPDLPALAARRQLDQRLDALLDTREGAPATVVFVCANAAASAAAPDELLVAVPCIGWLHPTSVERALRRGAARVEVRRCRDHEQPAREGARWLDARLAGARHPSPRRAIDPERVAQRCAPPGAKPADAAPVLAPRRAGLRVSASASALLLAAVVIGRSPVCGGDERGELVVAVRHRALAEERCVARSAEELATLPPHMRSPQRCERSRPTSTLRVWLDGAQVMTRALVPGGLSGDGAAIMLERLRITPGPHNVRVELESGAARYTREASLEVGASSRHALVLEDKRGWRIISGGYDTDHGSAKTGE